MKKFILLLCVVTSFVVSAWVNANPHITQIGVEKNGYWHNTTASIYYYGSCGTNCRAYETFVLPMNDIDGVFCNLNTDNIDKEDIYAYWWYQPGGGWYSAEGGNYGSLTDTYCNISRDPVGCFKWVRQHNYYSDWDFLPIGWAPLFHYRWYDANNTYQAMQCGIYNNWME